jgi:NADH-quinone oxidoreductase subunit J
MVVRSANPVHSAIWLIVNLMSVAVMYYALNAPFLMAVQLIVYAGAIVVLFLFVVMLLGPSREEGAHPHLAWLRPAAFAGAALLLLCLVAVAWHQTGDTASGTAAELIGDPASIGRRLYTVWLLPFEATSILLLAALVGALYLGRQNSREPGAELTQEGPDA